MANFFFFEKSPDFLEVFLILVNVAPNSEGYFSSYSFKVEKNLSETFTNKTGLNDDEKNKKIWNEKIGTIGTLSRAFSSGYRVHFF